MADPFSPRAAALAAGAAAIAMAEQGPGAPGPRTQARIRAESAQAIATGLVYVGDQIGQAPTVGPEAVDPATYLPFLEARLVEVPEGGRARFTVGPLLFEVHLGETFRLYVDLAGQPDVRVERGYKAALEKIANHAEHMGSGPADDEMREIAIGALAAGER